MKEEMKSDTEIKPLIIPIEVKKPYAYDEHPDLVNPDEPSKHDIIPNFDHILHYTRPSDRDARFWIVIFSPSGKGSFATWLPKNLFGVIERRFNIEHIDLIPDGCRVVPKDKGYEVQHDDVGNAEISKETGILSFLRLRKGIRFYDEGGSPIGSIEVEDKYFDEAWNELKELLSTLEIA